MEKVFEIGDSSAMRSGLSSTTGVHLYGGVRNLRRLQHHAGADSQHHPGGCDGGIRLARSPARADADGKITEYDFSGDWPVKTDLPGCL
jgi:hypothetical protein